MGGTGSGRKPSEETIVARMTPEITPVGEGLFLPDYSGIQTAALKTSKPLGTGTSSGGGHTIQEEGVPLTQRTNLNFSGSGVIATDNAVGDATTINIIGGGVATDHATLSNLDYAVAAHTGFASSTLVNTISGTATSLSGSLWALSGSNYTEHTILSGVSVVHTANISSLSGSMITLSGVSVVHTANISSLSGSMITLSGVSVVHTSNIKSLSGSMINLSGSVLISGANILTLGTLSGAKIQATTISGSNIFVTEDYTTFSGAYVAGIVFGTGSTPPTASNFPQGTIYVQYTP